MKKIILMIQMLVLSTFVFAMPNGRWWVPECNSLEHDHEYEEGYFELCYSVNRKINILAVILTIEAKDFEDSLRLCI